MDKTIYLKDFITNNTNKHSFISSYSLCVTYQSWCLLRIYKNACAKDINTNEHFNAKITNLMLTL